MMIFRNIVHSRLVISLEEIKHLGLDVNDPVLREIPEWGLIAAGLEAQLQEVHSQAEIDHWKAELANNRERASKKDMRDTFDLAFTGFSLDELLGFGYKADYLIEHTCIPLGQILRRLRSRPVYRNLNENFLCSSYQDDLLMLNTSVDNGEFSLITSTKRELMLSDLTLSQLMHDCPRVKMGLLSRNLIDWGISPGIVLNLLPDGLQSPNFWLLELKNSFDSLLLHFPKKKLVGAGLNIMKTTSDLLIDNMLFQERLKDFGSVDELKRKFKIPLTLYRAYGISAMKMLNEEPKPKPVDLFRAGYGLSELREAGCKASDLKDYARVADLLEAGYRTEELLEAGISTERLLLGGCPLRELLEIHLDSGVSA